MWVTDVGEAHPGDEKTTPSVWFWRKKYGDQEKWMVAFLSGEHVAEFSSGDKVFTANIDTET